MGVTKRDPRMLESVTWLSSTDVMISSAPVMMAISRLECADNWKSVWFQKSITWNTKHKGACSLNVRNKLNELNMKSRACTFSYIHKLSLIFTLVNVTCSCALLVSWATKPNHHCWVQLCFITVMLVAEIPWTPVHSLQNCQQLLYFTFWSICSRVASLLAWDEMSEIFSLCWKTWK